MHPQSRKQPTEVLTNHYKMKHSENVGEIAQALAHAQGAMMGALKDSSNPFFKSKYADLASVYAACKDQLSKNDIAVIQSPESTEDCVVTIVETILIHKSGQWIRGELRMLPVKNDPQGVGSCITYARRYALAAMVGVAPEDDDGNRASGREESKAYSSPKNNPSTPAMTKQALREPGVEMAPKSNRKAPSSPVQVSEVIQTSPEEVDQTGELNWRLMKIPIGTNIGKTLGEVDDSDRELLFKSFKADPRNSAHTYFKAALVLWFKEASASENK